MNVSYSVPIGAQADAAKLLGEAERRQKEHEIVLGDAQLDVPALRGFLPFEEALDLLEREKVRLSLRMIYAVAVDPSAQIGAHGNVR